MKILKLLILLPVILLVSCGDDPIDGDLCQQAIDASMNCGFPANTSIDQQNETEIQSYLTANNLSSQRLPSGLHYIIEEQGTGEAPTVCNNVNLHYHGTFLDGRVFDSSVDRGETIDFVLANLICGWQLGLPKIAKDGKIKLLIPARLGYGYQAVNGIPAGSVLIFDIELFQIN